MKEGSWSMEDVRSVAVTVTEAYVTSQKGAVWTGVSRDSTVRHVNIPVQTTVYITCVTLRPAFVNSVVQMVSMATCVT